MFERRHRFRHGYLGVARRERNASLWIRGGVVTVIALLGLGLWKGLSWLRTDWRVDHPAVMVQVEKGGSVTLSVAGEEAIPIEGVVDMYEGDTLHTEEHSTAAMGFFDGTRIHLDGETSITIEEMRKGRKEDAIGLELLNGKIFVALPKGAASGEILRHMKTPVFSLEFPPGTEALVTRDTLAVFDAGNTLGVVLRVPGTSTDLFIGEGQQITIPEDLTGKEQNIYAFRSPLESALQTSPFVKKSRTVLPPPPPPKLITELPPPEETLNVLAPEEGAIVLSASIDVRGIFGKGVTSIRVNGYLATIEGNTFSKELALPSDEKVDIRITALNADGIILAEESRTVRRDLKPTIPPTILAPAGSGATFRTAKTELELRGNAPEGAAGIVVNDYRLQLFQLGDRTWSYLASTNLGNFHPGMNTYDIVAIDDAGNRSAPVHITILLETGEEGIVEEGIRNQPFDKTQGKEPVTRNLNDILPRNPPTEPGSIAVTVPTKGEPYTTSRREFSIYGITSPNTHTVWVNNFRLQLYTPGKDTWKYITSVQMGTMKRGENHYTIIARDSSGNILDRLEYTVIFRPE